MPSNIPAKCENITSNTRCKITNKFLQLLDSFVIGASIIPRIVVTHPDNVKSDTLSAKCISIDLNFFRSSSTFDLKDHIKEKRYIPSVNGLRTIKCIFDWSLVSVVFPIAHSIAGRGLLIESLMIVSNDSPQDTECNNAAHGQHFSFLLKNQRGTRYLSLSNPYDCMEYPESPETNVSLVDFQGPLPTILEILERERIYRCIKDCKDCLRYVKYEEALQKTFHEFLSE